MKIIEPSFKIMFPEMLEGMLQRLEVIARTCYKSEDKIAPGSAETLCARLLKSGHYPMFDHCSVSVRVICDRGVSHELVRHRLAAYAQESTRYCNYTKGKFDGHLTFIKPCFFPNVPLGTFDIQSDFILASTDSHEANWVVVMLMSEVSYKAMIKHGCSPQEARSILPNSLKTEIVMTLDLTAWRHFFSKRAHPAAHPQMQEIAYPMLREFKKRIPLVFDDFERIRMMNEKESKIHLCDVCSRQPEVPVCMPNENNGIEFGNGIGNDNIIRCFNFNRIG